MNVNGFNFEGFIIPDFLIESGKMTRFWVEVVPLKNTDENAYLGVKKISKLISKIGRENNQSIYLCSNKPKQNICDFIKIRTVGDFLSKKLNIKTEELNFVIKLFGLKHNWKLKDLGVSHNKILAIIQGIELNKICVFDFYGFGPSTEIQLMKYLKIKLDKGKSLLSFENIEYKNTPITRCAL